MKIYILPVSADFRPKAAHAYPPHNDGHGIEQDMLEWLRANKQYQTLDPDIADWHYLPVFWTNFHVRNDYGTKNLDTLQAQVNKAVRDPARTFTVCQYDDGPLIHLDPETSVFLASRRKEERGEDVPLLAKAHSLPFLYRLGRPKKRFLACFSGRIQTSPVREQMRRELAGRDDIVIHDGHLGTSAFVKMLLESYVALCPRGYGGSSFRFFEAMQLGVTPLLISDCDTRPFKEYIDWDACSIFCAPGSVAETLSRYGAEQLLGMGENARKIFSSRLQLGKWPELLLRKLEGLRPSTQRYYTENDAVSFYIPAYNCEGFLEEAVESIMETNFSPGDELIIVDDASTDDTPVVIDRLKRKYPHILSFRHAANQGGGAARNRAILESANRLLFNLDADNVLERNSIFPLKKLLLEKQADAAAFSAIRFFSDGTSPDKTTNTWVYQTDKNGLFTLEMGLSKTKSPGNSGNYLFTKDSWLKAGGFHCDAFLDTWGFGIRQLFTGARVAILPDSHYFHRVGYQSYWVRESASGISASIIAMQILTRFFNEIEPWDVGYITGPYRDKWFSHLDTRPLRLKRNRSGTGFLLYLGKNIWLSARFYCREAPIIIKTWLLSVMNMVKKPLRPVYRKTKAAFHSARSQKIFIWSKLYTLFSQREIQPEFLNNRHMTIISTAFNNYKTIGLQLILMQKYLAENFTIIVADNSNDTNIRIKIKRICDKCHVPYIAIPRQWLISLNGSVSHAIALNWANQNIFGRCSSRYVGFVDHDMFPFRPTTISSFFAAGAVAAGLWQIRGSTRYLWPGFVFFDRLFLRSAAANFLPCAGLDTGGGLFFTHYRHLAEKDVYSVEEKYEPIRKTDECPQSSVASILGDWLHTRNASYWRPCPPKENDILHFMSQKTGLKSLQDEVNHVLS